jgi:hypothetical protein
MTIESQPAVTHYIPASPTQEPRTTLTLATNGNDNVLILCCLVDYADLAILDFAKASTSEGRAELAAAACDALQNVGFFYVVNHGLSTYEVSTHVASTRGKQFNQVFVVRPSVSLTLRTCLSRKLVRTRNRHISATSKRQVRSRAISPANTGYVSYRAVAYMYQRLTEW